MPDALPGEPGGTQFDPSTPASVGPDPAGDDDEEQAAYEDAPSAATRIQNARDMGAL